MCNASDWFMNINGIWQLSSKKQASCALHLSAGTFQVLSRENEFAKEQRALMWNAVKRKQLLAMSLAYICLATYFSYPCGWLLKCRYLQCNYNIVKKKKCLLPALSNIAGKCRGIFFLSLRIKAFSRSSIFTIHILGKAEKGINKGNILHQTLF